MDLSYTDHVSNPEDKELSTAGSNFTIFLPELFTGQCGRGMKRI